MKFTVLGYFAANFTREESDQALFEFQIHQLNYFEGVIEMNKGGSFQGTLIDRFGRSTIEGTMDHLMLTFKKVYNKDASKNAAKMEIQYTFGRSRLATFNKIPLPGCWNGYYEIPTSQPLEASGYNKGKAVLAMFEI